MVCDLNWYHNSQSHQIVPIFYYMSKLATRRDQLGGKRLHGFHTSSVSRSVCMQQRKPGNSQEWQRCLTVAWNIQQHQQVQNMLGQKALQVHQINCRSRQKPWHQCKWVSNPIPINWLTFHLALQTRMLSRHKLFELLFQQIQHLGHLRTLKCRSCFTSFRHQHHQFCHLGSPSGGNCWMMLHKVWRRSCWRLSRGNILALCKSLLWTLINYWIVAQCRWLERHHSRKYWWCLC